MDITEKWAEYASKVLPDIDPEFKRIAELCFLAGAQAMISVLSDLAESESSGNDDIDEEKASALVDRQQTLITKHSNEILSD